MSTEMKVDGKRLYQGWEILAGVAAVVGIAVAIIIALTGKEYQSSFNWKSTFVAGQATTIVEKSLPWHSGDLSYGVYHDYGTIGTRYDIYWRPVGQIYILEFSNGYCAKNDYYYGEWYMHHPNGFSKYDYKLVKKTYTSTKSKLDVYLLLD